MLLVQNSATERDRANFETSVLDPIKFITNFKVEFMLEQLLIIQCIKKSNLVTDSKYRYHNFTSIYDQLIAHVQLGVKKNKSTFRLQETYIRATLISSLTLNLTSTLQPKPSSLFNLIRPISL